jgi:hypothetical protein
LPSLYLWKVTRLELSPKLHRVALTVVAQRKVHCSVDALRYVWLLSTDELSSYLFAFYGEQVAPLRLRPVHAAPLDAKTRNGLKSPLGLAFGARR